MGITKIKFGLKKGGTAKGGATIPTGISCRFSGGWVLTSAEYRARTRYRSVKFAHMTKDEAVERFVTMFGTERQKREFGMGVKAA